MLLLTATTDKLQLVTSAAADVDVHASMMDHTLSTDNVEGVRQNTAITTGTVTDIVAAPASGVTRNVKTLHIRNKDSADTTDVTVIFDQNSTDFQLYKTTLKPGETLEYIEGVGFFVTLVDTVPTPLSSNFSVVSQGPGFASDTYVSFSGLSLAALGAPTIGRRYNWRFVIVKTAAGTATPIFTVRVGTAGTTSDTARITFTWGAGTAAIDRGEFEIECLVTTAGASGVLRGKANLTSNLTTTGLSNAVKALLVSSSAFDMTVANSIIGISYNGGASASHTIESCSAWTDKLGV